MGKLTEQIQAGPQTKPLPCIVRRWLETLDDEDRAVFAQACADDTWGHAALYETARENGYPGGDNRLVKHRRGECSCG